MNKFDIIVVGAGPAGLMAAIRAAQSGCSVALIDKNKKVGKKLLMTGAGRCNVTNSRPVDEIIANVPGNGRFLHSAFSQFSNLDIISFFEKNGVALKEEDHGRLFPTTNRSKTIVDALFNSCLNLGVQYFPETNVLGLLIENGEVKGIKTAQTNYFSPAVILATGGKTYPSTGATGDGYTFAKSAGHTITRLYATESALLSHEKFIEEKTLQGISLKEIELSVLNAKGKSVVKHQHDLLFTHFGLSGPAALRCSSFVNKLLEKGEKEVTLSLDLFPEIALGQLTQKLSVLTKSNKSLKNACASLLQERLFVFLAETAGLDPNTPAKQCSKKEIDALSKLMKSFHIKVYATFPIEKSFVTGGGVTLSEINPQTLESKKTKGLYMVGELLDINGYTGGYNITCAFVTGAVAGQHSSAAILQQNK
ncbi:aminoacetone oxidase family FAD-binding enzyme [Lactococcus hircilactis]|uniref:Aminoacetone oxidase family FAD-binding enzyme n=1 Tax=Lactococcus hircilactis TaxID=1494462 RepID=A0A7X2D0I8_9LACT|nr:NAD(P)/FAD-dependent oxidoreductase [Lactococcus hircilactis]MQW39533.1 aminoacetone oxidase family FAD-binding enzyme [Lactococcus hircilactis]